MLILLFRLVQLVYTTRGRRFTVQADRDTPAAGFVARARRYVDVPAATRHRTGGRAVTARWL